MRDQTKYEQNEAVSFHVVLRRVSRIADLICVHTVGHLQRSTVDNQADIARLSRDLLIRRIRKGVQLVTESRVMVCVSQYDSNAHSRLLVSLSCRKSQLEFRKRATRLRRIRTLRFPQVTFGSVQ